MVLSQEVSVSLSIIALVGLMGAGVAVGSGVGMMTMAAAEEAKKQESAAPGVVAHSPLERVVISRGFAASVLNH